VLGPGAPDWVEPFFFGDGTGLGFFSIDPSAPIGARDSGLLDVQYQIFSADPNGCPTCSIGFGDLTLPFNVEVAAPEPAPLWLIGLGMCWIGWRIAAGSAERSEGH
jgi:hypothetical protein